MNLLNIYENSWELSNVKYFREKFYHKIIERALNESKYSKMDQVKFVEDMLKKFEVIRSA